MCAMYSTHASNCINENKYVNKKILLPNNYTKQLYNIRKAYDPRLITPHEYDEPRHIIFQMGQDEHRLTMNYQQFEKYNIINFTKQMNKNEIKVHQQNKILYDCTFGNYYKLNIEENQYIGYYFDLLQKLYETICGLNHDIFEDGNMLTKVNTIDKNEDKTSHDTNNSEMIRRNFVIHDSLKKFFIEICLYNIYKKMTSSSLVKNKMSDEINYVKKYIMNNIDDMNEINKALNHFINYAVQKYEIIISRLHADFSTEKDFIQYIGENKI